MEPQRGEGSAALSPDAGPSSALIPPTDRAPYELPLDHASFAHALLIGHGRALQHARNHPGLVHEDDLLYALLHHPAHDPQCEDRDSAWTLRVLDAACLTDRVVPRFLELVNHEPTKTWRRAARSHRNTTLRLLARRGSPRARELLYARLTPAESGDDYHGIWDLIALDGADGLVHGVEFMARHRQNDPAAPLVDHLPDSADRMLAEHRGAPGDPEPGHQALPNARELLESLRSDRPLVDAWLRDLEAFEHERDGRRAGRERAAPPHREPPPELSTPNIIDAIEGTGCLTEFERDFILQKLRSWRGRTPQPDLDALVDRLDRALEQPAANTDGMRLAELYTLIFCRLPMPRVTDRIVAMLDHTEFRVRRRARHALRKVRAPQLRARALAAIDPGRLLSRETGLLESNLEPGDERRIEAALWLPDNTEERRDVCSNLLAPFRDDPGPACLNLLLFVYEHTPCSTCRRSSVRAMRRAGLLPEWIEREIRDDAIDMTPRDV